MKKKSGYVGLDFVFFVDRAVCGVGAFAIWDGSVHYLAGFQIANSHDGAIKDFGFDRCEGYQSLLQEYRK